MDRSLVDFFKATRQGELDIINRIINQGVDLNRKFCWCRDDSSLLIKMEDFPLLIAADQNNLDLIKLLLQSGANIDNDF